MRKKARVLSVSSVLPVDGNIQGILPEPTELSAKFSFPKNKRGWHKLKKRRKRK